ncbi:MAG TPA: sialidase family protein [Verrucomicrobiae bacterium]
MKLKLLAALTLGLLSLTWQSFTSEHGEAIKRLGIHSLDVYADGGTMHLLIADYQPNGQPILLHQRSTDGGKTWSTRTRVDAGIIAPSSPNRGMDAQIAGAGDKLGVVWMIKGTGLFNSGPLVTTISQDGGKTWRVGPNPADDGLTTGHSFSDLCADSAGNFHLAWLDSRDGRQGLRYARSTDGGVSWQKNQTLKPDTCECCWNKLAAGPTGPLVLFRDKKPRDMALLTSPDGGTQWNKQTTVGNFSWDFNGCPHVGGGLATETKGKTTTTHAVVWTGKAEESGVYHLSSKNNKSWSKPQRLGTNSARRGDVATGAKGIGIVWEENEDGDIALMFSTSKDGKKWSKPERIREASTTAAYPRIIGTTDGFHILWTETASGRGTLKQTSR